MRFTTLKTRFTQNLFNLEVKEVVGIYRSQYDGGISTPIAAGNSAIKAMDILDGLRVIVVTHVTGLREPNTQEFAEENRRVIESKGGAILTAAHAFSGLSVATRNKYQMPGIGIIIADTLRIFGQGMKVACEIALMAADAGLVRTDEYVISIGGTSRGSDTALVLTPVNTHRFFDLKVKEILCKPRL